MDIQISGEINNYLEITFWNSNLKMTPPKFPTNGKLIHHMKEPYVQES